MKGLTLSEKYFDTYGKPMLKAQFPDYEEKIAAGLVGEGSECFGYDDTLSMDHDFGPGFCLWVPDEVYDEIGICLQEAYQALPENYLGYCRIPSRQAGQRTGVFRITDFYQRFIGNKSRLSNDLAWLTIPEELLACAVNGKVFCDPLGEFSAIRSFLQNHYPEDIRMKKIAARFALMAQAGQYNYDRSMQRKDYVSARQALDIFIRESIALCFLLNKTYMPYYKWSFRRLTELPAMNKAAALIEELSVLPVTEDYKAVQCIESICCTALKETASQGIITLRNSSFLDDYTQEITSHIANPDIRSLHIMQG